MCQSTINHLAVGWIDGGNASTAFENDSEPTLDTAPALGRVAVTVERHLIVDEGDREDVGLACVEGFRKAFNEDGG